MSGCVGGATDWAGAGVAGGSGSSSRESGCVGGGTVAGVACTGGATGAGGRGIAGRGGVACIGAAGAPGGGSSSGVTPGSGAEEPRGSGSTSGTGSGSTAGACWRRNPMSSSKLGRAGASFSSSGSGPPTVADSKNARSSSSFTLTDYRTSTHAPCGTTQNSSVTTPFSTCHRRSSRTVCSMRRSWETNSSAPS